MRGSTVVAALAVAAVVGPAGPAWAGGYTVNACNAAGGPSGSWVAQDGSAHTYRVCPTGSAGGDSQNHGMVTRATDRTFPKGAFSRLWFFAPAGTTIDGLHWSGRWNRNHRSWSAQLRAQGGEDRLLTGIAPFSGPDSYDGSYGVIWLAAPPGTTRLMQNVQCGAASCPPGVTFHTFHAAVSVNDPQGPGVSEFGGGLGGGRWVGRDQALTFLASDNVGIRDAAVSVAGRPGGSTAAGCDYTRSKPGSDLRGSLGFSTDQLPDGTHPVRVAVTDCAGNPGHADTSAKIDNTPPGRVAPAVVDGDGWRGRNRFDLRWKPYRGDGFAPVVRTHYRLCAPDGGCTSGSREGNIDELSGVAVTAPGEHLLTVRLEDEAGNVAAESDPAHLRFDPDPPQVAFEATDDSDPLRVSVAASDAASGIAGGEIELRRRGGRTWHPLETTVEGSGLVAYVDDERFRRGRYEFRARAVDGAGNERSTDRRADGARAGLALPVRFATRLRAGLRRVRITRRKVRRKGRRHVVRRRTVRFVGHRRVRPKRRLKLRGVLTNPDGQPIDGATIDVYARPRYGGRPFAPVGRAVTDLRGRFSYIARARFSRVLRFRYEGTGTIKSATDEFVAVVGARSTIHVNHRRVRNGASVRFRGRLRGGRVPAEGKVTFLQAVVRGKWRTFATPRANRNGRWRYRYRFGATTGTVRYRFRLCIPRDSAYPFDFGCSRPIAVTVRGP